MKKVAFTLHDGYYMPSDISHILSLAVSESNLTGNSKGNYFYNLPCAFDIETTSFYRDEQGRVYDYQQAQATGAKLEKQAIMYVWQFGINGYCIIGRTWPEFVTLCKTISETLQLNEKKRLVVYVHNLAYDFQFIRLWLTWAKVFATDERKPLYAITTGGIEFRCSYQLSGYSLAKLAEHLQTYHVGKLVGDLDYSLLRHSQTPLTAQEIEYCLNDIRIVMCYIQEEINRAKLITRLPLTKTGYVRKFCRGITLRQKVDGKSKPNWRYLDLMQELQITGMSEFNALQRAFMGGFTHANGLYSSETLENVESYDFTSSYPYVMVSEQFPMSRAVVVNVKNMQQFETLISKYCCVFDIEFTTLMSKQTQDNPISASKCFVLENAVNNNGRVVCASRVAMTITDVDYKVYKAFYNWDSMRVGQMYCYRRGYLPTEFVKAILRLYADKTRLKGVVGKEVEYLSSKEMLNSCYGMCVTNPLRDEITYNAETWGMKQPTPSEKEEMLYKYNNSRNRFLFYPWGIYVTAYARRNLFTGIYACGNDYVYSDTDSIKLLNADAHRPYFDAYNRVCARKLEQACAYHTIDYAECAPKTIKGVSKPLGVWDYEGCYTRFKTLGAKRYMTETNGKLSLTVSGVNKHVAVPYLQRVYGKEVFAHFDNYLDIPPQATGKNIHTYIDYQTSGELTDYMGNAAPYLEQTGVHLEPTGYTMSLSVMYLNYLRGIKFKQ